MATQAPSPAPGAYTLETLPADVLDRIVDFLDITSLCRLLQVSRTFAAYGRDEQLWRRRCRAEYPPDVTDLQEWTDLRSYRELYVILGARPRGHHVPVGPLPLPCSPAGHVQALHARAGGGRRHSMHVLPARRVDVPERGQRLCAVHLRVAERCGYLPRRRCVCACHCRRCRGDVFFC